MLQKFAPGLMLAVFGAVLAEFGGKYSGPLNDVVLAIIFGFLIRNLLILPKVSAGLNFDVKYILRLAIILLGVQFSWEQLIATSGHALWIIFIVVAAAIPVVYFISIKLHLSNKMASLLGVGSAICGATAILATGPAIEAKEQDMALAIATIFIFNTVALITYPMVGHFLEMPDVVYGTWVGTAVQDISSVVATGFAYTADAGRVATVVKLARTVLIVPVVFLFTLFFSTNRKQVGKGNYARIFPWFVLGFLAVALLNSAGTFPAPVKSFLTGADHFLVLMVMIGVGYMLKASEIKKVGFRFLISGMTGMAIMSGASLLLIASYIWR